MNVLDELEVPPGGGAARRRRRRIAAQHAKGKLTARERIELLLDEGSLRGVRHVRRATAAPTSAWRSRAARGRRRGHRLGHDQRPAWSMSSARTSPSSAARCRRPTPQKICKIMDMAMQNGAPVIGLNDSGGARIQEGVASPRRLCRGVPAQHPGLGRGAADQRHHGALRRRRGLFAGDDRLHLHGAGHLLHVRHRPRRGEDGDERDRHGRGAGRRDDPHPQVLGRRRRLRERRRGAGRRCGGWWTSCRSTTARSRRCGRSSTRRTGWRTSLDTLVPANPNTPYDMKELILKVADEGDFFEIQEDFAQQHPHRLHPAGGRDGRRGGEPADGAGRLPRHRLARARPRASCGSATPSRSRS